MTLLMVEIPMKLPSCANLREHWATRAKRVKQQRLHVICAVRFEPSRNWLRATAAGGEQLTVTLTRIGRKLDSDNLASAFKAVRDQVAAELGIDDGSDAVDWQYRQQPGKAGIRIEISRSP